jgi:cold shock CspA family protein
MKGTIKKWLYDHGYGFIKVNSIKNDVFCHSRDVRNCYDLDKGDLVEFEIKETDKGPKAINVKIIYN